MVASYRLAPDPADNVTVMPLPTDPACLLEKMMPLVSVAVAVAVALASAVMLWIVPAGTEPIVAALNTKGMLAV
jgi:hypothetical protein